MFAGEDSMSNCLCLGCKKKSALFLESRRFRSEKRREELTELIEKNPGVSFRDLMRFTNMKNGVLSHHLRRLEKTESIKAERLSRQTRFYPRDFSDEESVIAKAMRKETPRDIISSLIANEGYCKEGLAFTQIVSNVSKSPSTVSLYLSQLVRDKVVTFTRNFGSKKKFYLSNKQLVERLAKDHKLGILEKPISGFEDIINSL